jgi:hypothetical protein
MKALFFSSSLLVLTLGAGCGSSVETGTGGGATTGSTTSTGSGGACAAYADQTGTGKVTLRFINKTGLPVYLNSSCAGGIGYSITHILSSDSTSYVYDTSCLQTCSDLQKEQPYECGPCAPQSIRLDPDAIRTIEWDGTGLQVPATPMPPSCYAPGGDYFPSCDQIVAALAGMYRADAIGYSECGPGCTCDANGLCNGSATGLQALPNPVSFSFPTSGTVDVIFDVCAFGCAGG